MDETAVLLLTALSLGFLHTLAGPDHYLPFIVIFQARQWSLSRTIVFTFLCGIGHILSSVLLGILGLACGAAVTRLAGIESARAEIAAWLLLIFGFTYFIWGVSRAIKNRPHQHVHTHPDGELHSHVHNHHQGHAHVHEEGGRPGLTPWILFTIFVFGPCEPLIPLLMYPAAKGSPGLVPAVVLVFGATTIATMLVVVGVSARGLSRLALGRMERYSHALAGLTIFLCAGAIKFLGL